MPTDDQTQTNCAIRKAISGAMADALAAEIAESIRRANADGDELARRANVAAAWNRADAARVSFKVRALLRRQP